MFCPKCGTYNDDNAYKCAQCGAVLHQALPTAPAAGVRVPNYLAQAILCTLFCCLPFGIVSIVYAASVNGKLAAGDISGAMQASRMARTWCWVSFGCGFAVILIYVIIFVIAGAASSF